MIHELNALYCDPEQFADCFRKDGIGLVYDPSRGRRPAKVVTGVQAAAVKAEYQIRYEKWHRYQHRVFKTAAVGIMVPPFLGAAGLMGAGYNLWAALFGCLTFFIMLANYRLWKLRSDFLQSIERNVQVARLSDVERIARSFRLSWNESLTFGAMLVIFGPPYLFLHHGQHPKFGRLLGMGENGPRIHAWLMWGNITLIGLGLLLVIIKVWWRRTRK